MAPPPHAAFRFATLLCWHFSVALVAAVVVAAVAVSQRLNAIILACALPRCVYKWPTTTRRHLKSLKNDTSSDKDEDKAANKYHFI